MFLTPQRFDTARVLTHRWSNVSFQDLPALSRRSNLMTTIPAEIDPSPQNTHSGPLDQRPLASGSPV